MTLCVHLTWDARNGSCWMKLPGMDRWPAFVKQNKEDQGLGILLRDVATMIKQYGNMLSVPTNLSYLEIKYRVLSERTTPKHVPSREDLAELTRFLRCWRSVFIKSDDNLPQWFTTRLVKSMEMISTNASLPFLRRNDNNNKNKKPKKTLRCINIFDDEDGSEDLFWHEQPYSSINILTGITHLFLNSSALDMFETFQQNLLVEWLKRDDSKRLESLEVTEAGVSNEVWEALSSVSHAHLRHVTLYHTDGDIIQKKESEDWSRFFQCNPTLTSLELDGYDLHWFETTRHILSLRHEKLHYLTFSSRGYTNEKIAYPLNDVLMVFNSHLWSWICNGPQVTFNENGLYRKSLYNASALESFSAHPAFMHKKRKYVRDWQRICLCIAFCRAMQNSPLLYSFLPLLPGILDATKLDPNPGDYIPMRQRKYFSEHENSKKSKKRKRI